MVQSKILLKHFLLDNNCQSMNEQEMEKIKFAIKALEERNAKVQADKAWETSFFRKASILLITYFLAVLVMYIIGIQKFWYNALIPTLGYFLSTLTLPLLKKMWIQKYMGK